MGDSLKDRMNNAITDLGFARENYPLWTEQGLEDYACTVHSMGMSLLSGMGLALGYTAISEMPAPSPGMHAPQNIDVRSDSAWFDRESHHLVLLAEFERYSGDADESKLLEKAGNLLVAHHRWDQSARYLVLAYWTKGLVNLPRHELLRERLSCGFETAARQRISGTCCGTVLFYQFVLSQAASGLWRLTQVIERGKA